MSSRSPVLGGAVRAGALAAGLAGVLLGAAACAGKPVPYGTQGSSAAATPAAGAGTTAPVVSQSPLPAASGQLTGTQLQTVLLPQSSFPAGFSLSPSSAVSSGGTVETAPGPVSLATMSCANFVSHLGDTGFGESAMAANSYTGTGQAFDQVVYQFGSSGTASAFVSGVKALAARCHSFTATTGGQSGTFSLSAVAAPPVAGHPSAELRQTGKIDGSTVTLDTLLTASGVDVFAAAAVGLGRPAPSNPAAATLVYGLMKRQAAAAVLG